MSSISKIASLTLKVEEVAAGAIGLGAKVALKATASLLVTDMLNQEIKTNYRGYKEQGLKYTDDKISAYETTIDEASGIVKANLEGLTQQAAIKLLSDQKLDSINMADGFNTISPDTPVSSSVSDANKKSNASSATNNLKKMDKRKK